ncbi:MAG: DUF3060 domain-containing protein [Pyrinomonadaceae bacterium]
MKKLAILLFVVILFGCSAEDKTGNQTAENNAVNVSPTVEEETGPLILSQTGNNGFYKCNGREVEVTKDASSNDYRLTGECKSLKVDGVSNIIDVDKVGKIEVRGTSNKIYYKELVDGKKPEIKIAGVNNEVKQDSKAEKSNN